MKYILRCLSLIALASLNGCGTTPAAKFYLLEASQPANAPLADATAIVVMAPVRIPRYLDRSQIVSADGHNGYQLSELNRWAEGLDHNITRVLQQDLSQLVPATVLLSAPAETSTLKLTVTILEFHVDAEGQASLKAQWQISRGNQLLGLHRQNYLKLASNSDYSKMVAGLNACLGQLSGDIATSLQKLPQP